LYPLISNSKKEPSVLKPKVLIIKKLPLKKVGVI
jgi:hypothetical protein